MHKILLTLSLGLGAMVGISDFQGQVYAAQSCFICEETGHDAGNCPLQWGDGVQKKRCSYCGGVGHSCEECSQGMVSPGCDTIPQYHGPLSQGIQHRGQGSKTDEILKNTFSKLESKEIYFPRSVKEAFMEAYKECEQHYDETKGQPMLDRPVGTDLPLFGSDPHKHSVLHEVPVASFKQGPAVSRQQVTGGPILSFLQEANGKPSSSSQRMLDCSSSSSASFSSVPPAPQGDFYRTGFTSLASISTTGGQDTSSSNPSSLSSNTMSSLSLPPMHTSFSVEPWTTGSTVLYPSSFSTGSSSSTFYRGSGARSTADGNASRLSGPGAVGKSSFSTCSSNYSSGSSKIRSTGPSVPSALTSYSSPVESFSSLAHSSDGSLPVPESLYAISRPAPCLYQTGFSSDSSTVSSSVAALHGVSGSTYYGGPVESLSSLAGSNSSTVSASGPAVITSSGSTYYGGPVEIPSSLRDGDGRSLIAFYSSDSTLPGNTAGNMGNAMPAESEEDNDNYSVSSRSSSSGSLFSLSSSDYGSQELGEH
ncbi:MAG: hypothetical protein RLZ12_800 [Bacillota bacterium]